MGYTTEFQGQFTFDKPADAETTLFMHDVFDLRPVPAGAPDTYCQWVITKDRLHIQWDGVEKFYAYVEWLQWLVDHKFTPASLTLSGTVKYSGEDIEDCGTISIQDGRVVKTPAVFERVRVHCPNCDEQVVATVVKP